jgi:ring-1,2-phenylacetyl-CoA epoxidase subunit PaaE
MAVHFHPLKISEIVRDTADSVIISFEVPENLLPLYTYSQGQNITLKATIDGETVRRSYSICTAPFDRKLSVAVKKASNGLFSTFANEHLQPGDVIEVLPPTGRFFTQLNPPNRYNYLAVAAGSGITPIISLVKTTLVTEPDSSFTLVYGNRTRSSIMFFEELQGLKNKYPQRFNLIHILSREQTDSPINHGRIDADKLGALGRMLRYTSFQEIFICGPERMVFCVKEFLSRVGVKPAHIHFELFTTPGQEKVLPGKQTADHPAPTEKNHVSVKLDGHFMNFYLEKNGESILDAALKLGADLPYACKGGVCSTCRAKLVEGEVTMDNNYALEPDEVENGFILTCQSHPLTSKVVIDFDSR